MIRLFNRNSIKRTGWSQGSSFLRSRNFLTSLSSLSELESKYRVGHCISGYRIDRAEPIEEFSVFAVVLTHLRTGSKHLHLDTKWDTNNVFLIAFKTNPPDATGVPHILEHTTLCGSKKFKVRDPFFKMLNRSLSNFMNAMTGHDYTFYPFATTNPKDFENLMDVYLSSVLEPLLTPEDFLQEGWRLENNEIEDINSPINFKGVVYNEMKGQYSNSMYYFWIKFQEHIYSSLNNSGGDPSCITNLSHQELVDFHRKNYHPSNAKTFTYGNMPLDSHLEKLNQYFKKYENMKVANEVKVSDFEGKYNSDVKVPGPVDTLSGKPAIEQFSSSITWPLLNPLNPTQQYEVFKWRVLGLLLCEGHSSPFYKELVEKNFGESFSVNTGVDITTALMSFSIGLNNLTSSQVDRLETEVMRIINVVVLPEFDRNRESVFYEKVEAILHQIELNFKRHKPDFGLSLLSSLVPAWVHDFDPITTLSVQKILASFKDEFSLKGLHMFNEMLKFHILEARQKLIFTVVPDENFSKEQHDDEISRLNSSLENLTPEDGNDIYERGLRLAQKQKEEEDVSVLPTLTIKDIPQRGEFYPVTFSDVGLKNIQKRITDCNGIVYMSALKEISYMPPQYYKFLPLFTSCLTNLAGTYKTSITELETRIQKYTGGVSFRSVVNTNPHDMFDAKLQFLASGFSLNSNCETVYDSWFEILTLTKFDGHDETVVTKLYTLIKELAQSQMDIIAEKGHSLASLQSCSHISPSKSIQNEMGGFEQISFVLEMNAELERKGKLYLVDEVLPVLDKIKHLILNGYSKDEAPGFAYSLVCDENAIAKNEDLIRLFDISLKKSLVFEELPNQLAQKVASFKNKLPLTENRMLFNMPFQVGYASLAKKGASYTSKDGAALQVLAQLLTFKHLHSVIRESNGAYGGGLVYDGLSGCLNFYSFRDPNPLASVDSFKKSFEISLDKLLHYDNGGWNSQDLQEALLAIFQSLDAPMNVALQGSMLFVENISDEMRQQRRENFLSITFEDLKDIAEKYLVNESNNNMTVIADKNLYDLQSTDKQWTIKNI